jgi:hypothetical protein
VLQRDGVLVAHGLQVTGDDVGDGFGFRFRTEGTQTLHFFRQHHVVVWDVRYHEGAQLALAAYANRSRRTRWQGGQQVEYAVHLLHDDLALTHGLGRHQVQFFQSPIAVGQDVDGGGERCHRERRIAEGIVHDQAP